MADVAGEPHVGDHTGAVHIAQGDGFAGLDADAGAEFLAILAGSAARCVRRWDSRRKNQRSSGDAGDT